jgi:quinol monooxygenase YgiN
MDDDQIIIVIGAAHVKADRLEDVLAASLEHVRRSRTEPGCISHAVHQDVEDPLTLVFVEQWQDDDALFAHFAVPESGAFVRLLFECAAQRPVMNIYEATLRS